MYVLSLEFIFLSSFYCSLCTIKIFNRGEVFVIFYPTKRKWIVCARLSLPCTGVVLVAGRIRQSTECVSYYVYNYSYILNIRPKHFDNESPAHHPLRFTQGCDIYQILIIWEYVYFIAKNNSSKLLKVFHYCKKILIIRSLVTLWLAQYPWEEGNRFVVLDDNCI